MGDTSDPPKTPLHSAAARGDATAVGALLEDLPQDMIRDLVGVKDDVMGMTALHHAAMSKRGGPNAINALLVKVTPEQRLELLGEKDNQQQMPRDVAGTDEDRTTYNGCIKSHLDRWREM